MSKRRSRVFMIVILLLAAAVVLYALVLRDNSVDTPRVILPTAMPSADGGGASDGGDALSADVTPETVQAVIATLSRADSYSRTVTTQDYWDGGEAESRLSVWVHGGATRIRQESDGRNILLLPDKRLYIWYDDAEGYYAGGYTDRADADRWLRCLTYEELLDMDAGDIQDAAYVDFGGEGCIRAEYLTSCFGYRSVAYVSRETGLLMGAESWDGDTLIYRMTSTVPDITTPDESWFLPPDTLTETASPQE